jgi:hypothetical protein
MKIELVKNCRNLREEKIETEKSVTVETKLKQKWTKQNRSCCEIGKTEVNAVLHNFVIGCSIL